MAEEPPGALIHNMGCSNLEDVWLKLCVLQTQNSDSSNHEPHEDAKRITLAVRQCN